MRSEKRTNLRLAAKFGIAGVIFGVVGVAGGVTAIVPILPLMAVGAISSIISVGCIITACAFRLKACYVDEEEETQSLISEARAGYDTEQKPNVSHEITGSYPAILPALQSDREYIKVPEHKNLYDFYYHILIRLNDFCISVKSAAGGQTKCAKGSIGHSGCVIELFGDTAELIDAIPVAGPIIHTSLKWGVEKPLKAADERRQTNTMRQISKTIGFTPEKWQEKTARMLAQCYEYQLKKLRAEPETGIMAHAEEAIFRYQRLNPSEKFAEFCFAIMVEALISSQISADGSLEEQLFRAVTMQQPDTQHWSVFHNSGTVETIDGRIWPLDQICARCGVKTEDGRCFESDYTDTANYGFCLGSENMAIARRLRFTEQEMCLLAGSEHYCDEAEDSSETEEEPLRSEKHMTEEYTNKELLDSVTASSMV